MRKTVISFLAVVGLVVLILALVLALVLVVFAPKAIPETPGTQELLRVAAPYDVIILFNAGGWGNATLAESTDFASILTGVQNTLGALYLINHHPSSFSSCQSHQSVSVKVTRKYSSAVRWGG
jgi:hypothetical protein